MDEPVSVTEHSASTQHQLIDCADRRRRSHYPPDCVHLRHASSFIGTSPCSHRFPLDLILVLLQGLAKRLSFLQNAVGNALAPFDCWLLMRGVKTMAVSAFHFDDTDAQHAQRERL